jgi:hypothetical protein
MNSNELSDVTALPIQVVGMSFYFDPLTAARAKELGLNVFQFYGLGRGGVLGDVDLDVVNEAFTFFSPASIARMWGAPVPKADPAATAAAYLQAAYEFADRTFGAVGVDVLANFARAAHKVVAAVAGGHHLLVDGYRQYEVSSDQVHAAYLGAILMRELRGCVHIDAVREVGLSPLEASYLQDPSVFKMHGYGDDDVPRVTPELEAKKAQAEVVTSAAMAECFAVLDDDQRDQLAQGALAMFEALKSPVAVVG